MHLCSRLVLSGLLALAICEFAHAATVTGRVRDANTNSFLLGATVSIREAQS
jgi:hypothetical protein